MRKGFKHLIVLELPHRETTAVEIKFNYFFWQSIKKTDVAILYFPVKLPYEGFQQ